MLWALITNFETFDVLVTSVASRNLSSSVVIVRIRHVEVYRTQITGQTSDVFVLFIYGRTLLLNNVHSIALLGLSPGYFPSGFRRTRQPTCLCLVAVLAAVSARAIGCGLGGTLAIALLLVNSTLRVFSLRHLRPLQSLAQ